MSNPIKNNSNTTNTSSGGAGTLHDTPPPTADAIRESTVKLAQDLNTFCASHTFQTSLPVTVDTVEQQTVLQLSICRKLRELLPTTNCAALLQTAQQQHWIPVLLQWLNIHDRPAVQVEALLAVTNIAEVCAQTSSAATTAAAVTAGAAWPSLPAAAAGTTSFQEAMEAANKYTSAVSAAAAAAAAANPLYAAPGSVPFPPLSFSQSLSPDAVAAFEQTIQTSAQDKHARENGSTVATTVATGNNTTTGSLTTTQQQQQSLSLLSGGKTNSTTTATTSTTSINFTSLAPPPGGAHSSVPTNAFMPPPTPVANSAGSLSFPQQLSASSQHLLLRHADAIPTLIRLLGSPSREVYEQAMWILGSIAAGDAAPSLSATSGSNSSSNNTNSGSNSNNNNTSGTNSNNTSGTGDKQVSARDVILAAGVMQQLLRCLEAHPTNLSLQRIGSWTLSNLLDNIFQAQQPSSSSQSQGSTGSGSNNKNNNNNSSESGTGSSSNNSNKSNNNNGTTNNPGGSSDYSSADEIDMKALLPVLNRLLHMSDSEVLSYVCWSLSHLCDHASHIAQVVTTSNTATSKSKTNNGGGLVPRLVELLTHPSWRVTKPALRTIGNIVCAECSDDGSSSTATTDYTETILECGAVPKLKELITHSNREIQKEAAWPLSNIAAGTVEQIQAVIDSGAIPPLVNLVRDKKTDQEVRSEACWVVLNATSCGSDSQIEVLVDEGCVSVLGVLLSEVSMVMMALEGLERVLQVEETREMIRRQQIDSGEIDDDEENRTPILVSAALIEKARESHNNSSAVTKRADRIWRQHFVSCALCKQSFSKHRAADASFCEECKCHVCSNCNCKIYHLDYQEELWALTEEKTEAKKNAKKSKNKKKKAKLKEKKAKQQQDDTTTTNNDKDVKDNDKKEPAPQQPSSSSSKDSNDKKKEPVAIGESEKETKKSKEANSKTKKVEEKPRSASPEEEEEEDDDDAQNQIDLVLYLQQTGSIIALSKLMDALEYGGDDYDDELDDYERKMIREQQSIRKQATN